MKFVEKLISEGENLTVEFKEDKPLSDDAIVEAVVCLANRKGGYLVLGVDDFGRITGAKPYPRRGKEIDPGLLRAMIYSRTRPHLWVEVFVERVEGKDVIVVKVPRNFPSATSKGLYLMRSIGGDGKPACHPLEPHEFISIMSEEGLTVFGTKSLNLGLESLDESALKIARDSLSKIGRTELSNLPIEELLRILGAVSGDGRVTLNGLLMFGKEDLIREILPQHEVIFSVFDGPTLIHQVKFSKALISTFFDIVKEIKKRNTGVGEIVKGGLRFEVPMFHPESVREAIANALIHRNYATFGAVNVEVYTDGRLVVSNPGGFMPGVRVDNILSIPPKPRNPILAEAFRILGVVERTGRGVDKIYTLQAVYGKPLPIWDVRDESVKLTLISSEWSREIAEVLLGEDLMPEEVLIIYHIMKFGKLKISELSRYIQRNMEETEYFVRRLSESGKIESVDGFVLKPSESVDIEEEILKFIEKSGSVGRKEIVEKFGISSSRAFRILKSLVERGILVREGSGRKTRYRIKEV